MTGDAWRDEMRQEAEALRGALEAVMADVPLPPHAQEIVARCWEELAVVVAATDEATATLLESGAVQSFEALRGLMWRH